jgi:hypothetical protein
MMRLKADDRRITGKINQFGGRGHPAGFSQVRFRNKPRGGAGCTHQDRYLMGLEMGQ